MIRPAFVTFVTLSPWEPRLAEAARRTGLARLVGRCSTYAEVERLDPDVVVIGSSHPSLGPAPIDRWRRRGMVVVVIEEGGDPTLERRARGCHARFGERSSEMEILMFVAASVTHRVGPTNHTITVTGPRGSMGRSEVALALAWRLAEQRPVHLVDLDLDAPGLGLRLGLPPPPTPSTVEIGPLRFTGFPPGGGPLAPTVRDRLLASIETDVVIDAGPDARDITGTTVVVTRTDPQSLVRLGRYMSRHRWEGAVVVANFADTTTIGPLRRTIGGDPAALVPDLGPAEPGRPLSGMGDLLGAVTQLAPVSDRVA